MATAWYFIDAERAFVVTLSVLVVTCPCALALATPTAFAAAGSRLSQLKLLLTNGNAVEALSRATLAVFDKTGTLTVGAPRISAVHVVDTGRDEDDYRHIAAALEHASTHPLARAFIINDALPEVDAQQVHVGQGVSGIVAGREWRLGSAAFVGVEPETDARETTRVFLGNDGTLAAWFELEDALRPEAESTLTALRAAGLRTALISGDHRAAVESVAARLGIEESHHDCSPEAKLEVIEAAQRRGERVLMIGDGINDAPVLAGADTSIAPAHGALLAQTSADVIMLGESLAPLTTAVAMARKTMRIVRQNLAWAIVYNALALPLAAAGFVPPWAAAIGMSASSLIVVLNALRLNRFE